MGKKDTMLWNNLKELRLQIWAHGIYRGTRNWLNFGMHCDACYFRLHGETRQDAIKRYGKEAV